MQLAAERVAEKRLYGITCNSAKLRCMNTATERNYVFGSVTETEFFARTVSLWARPNQLIELAGDLGAGKSTLARALIRSLAKSNEEFDIPSPSFALVQIYENTRIPVAHIDLYRLTHKSQIQELGIDELVKTHLVIVEWPDMLHPTLCVSRLTLRISGTGEARQVTLQAQGDWIDQLSRNDKIEKFLASTAWHGAQRTFLEGDASSRRYETVTLGEKSAILMDMPQRPDGPPVKNGKAYSSIAHLAENIQAVVATNKHLKSTGYSSPMMEDYNLTSGLAIIEDLGGLVFGRMMRDGCDMSEPMMTAVEVLADMAVRSWPAQFPIDDAIAYHVPYFDVEAQLIEVDLLLSWFWSHVHSEPAPEHLRVSFEMVWRELLILAKPDKPHLVLRDFHSPNLIWMPSRVGLQRVGLIDTQDCLIGHAAYDLASLLQDARVDIDFRWADELYKHYERLRMNQGQFDQTLFKAAYAVLAAQRATKILGIFARLSRRDGKSGYLQHMPRVAKYLSRNLEHESLLPLKLWYEKHLPEALSLVHK
jgi:N-acetylmuramate 1-kinase